MKRLKVSRKNWKAISALYYILLLGGFFFAINMIMQGSATFISWFAFMIPALALLAIKSTIIEVEKEDEAANP